MSFQILKHFLQILDFCSVYSSHIGGPEQRYPSVEITHIEDERELFFQGLPVVIKKGYVVQLGGSPGPV